MGHFGANFKKKKSEKIYGEPNFFEFWKLLTRKKNLKVSRNGKKKFFLSSTGKNKKFSQSYVYIKSFMVLSYFRLKWTAEIKKIEKFNFGAAVSQKYASGSVKYEWFHKSQVKNDPKKIFFFFFIFQLVVLPWTCPYIYIKQHLCRYKSIPQRMLYCTKRQ